MFFTYPINVKTNRNVRNEKKFLVEVVLQDLNNQLLGFCTLFLEHPAENRVCQKKFNKKVLK